MCSCEPCSMCGGKGTYYVDLRGRVTYAADDLCDLETCDECGGSGIEHECEHCYGQRELDEDAGGEAR